MFGFVGAPARLAAGYFNRDLLPDLVTTVTRQGQVAVLPALPVLPASIQANDYL